MNIVILGAGAIGSLFGALLSKNNNVFLISRKSHVKAIRKNGLIIDGITKLNTKIYASDSVDNIPFSPDLIIITVKSYDTKTAINQVKKIINKNTIILSLQNGLNNISDIENVVDQSKIIAGITTVGAFFPKPGKVIHTGIGETIIGELFSKKSDRIKLIKRIFSKSNIDTIVSEDIKKEIWIKAIINSSINPITAFFSCKNGYLLKNPVLEKIVEKVCRESTIVAMHME